MKELVSCSGLNAGLSGPRLCVKMRKGSNPSLTQSEATVECLRKACTGGQGGEQVYLPLKTVVHETGIGNPSSEAEDGFRFH